tara:strand:- start:2913 stop:3818 length:906 start_codon:yes stop_codon:yes gene_type:complete
MTLLNCKGLTALDINTIFLLTDEIYHISHKSIAGKILVNVFFEPSTRTALSFECAMKRLGGNVINFQKDVSSLKKGESYEDTIKTLSTYGDLMVLRHPEIGKVSKASTLIDIPIINAGDGAGEHPTQALLDLYTIYKHFGEDFKNKTILFVGDLKNSRTIHSLISLVHLYPEMKIYILSYPGLEPDEQLLEKISKIHQQPKDSIVFSVYDIDYSLFDVVYITRLQRERAGCPRYAGGYNVPRSFIMTNELANTMKEDAIIMHPLPRNEEIHPDVDDNHRCHYFKQMKYGVDIRMAIIFSLF